MSKDLTFEMLVHQLSSVLPDDRPITAISIVEDIDKCPPNFKVVSRTYDQDTDADLWRESGLFIKKKGRYICFSKTEGIHDYIMEDLAVINERESPPEGFSMISHTVDSTQKAWRKKQLCYKMRKKETCSKAVTDIIICSRILNKTPAKMAPHGFLAAGIINGVCVCYKTTELVNRNSDLQSYANIESFHNFSPNPSNGTVHKTPPERPPKPKFSPNLANGIYPQIRHGNGSKDGEKVDRDYEILSPNSARIRPTRPAPQPPTSPAIINSTQIYGTLSGSSDLDGVPFILNPRLTSSPKSYDIQLPVVKALTNKELDEKFFYDFRAERET